MFAATTGYMARKGRYQVKPVATSESPSRHDKAPEPHSLLDSPGAQSPLIRAQQVHLEMRVSFLCTRPPPSPDLPRPPILSPHSAFGDSFPVALRDPRNPSSTDGERARAWGGHGSSWGKERLVSWVSWEAPGDAAPDTSTPVLPTQLGSRNKAGLAFS